MRHSKTTFKNAIGCVFATVVAVSSNMSPVKAADPIVIDITTTLGNDTLFVGMPGSIIFYVNATGWNLSSIGMPLAFDFGGQGNFIGPITENPADPAVFTSSAYALQHMEGGGLYWPLGADFTDDPDVMGFGAVDFDGEGWDTAGELARITFTPTDIGSIQIRDSFAPPVSGVYLIDQNGNDVPFNWYDPYVITVAECPVKMGDVNEDGDINSSDLIYMVNYIFKSGPDPIPMRTVGDANCTGGLGASDIIYLVNHIFKGGPPPCACYVRII